MKSLLTALYLLLTSIVSYAGEGKVVLLTSLLESRQAPRSANQRLERSAERRLRERFRRLDYEVVVEHRVTPRRLWEVLNDREVVGLFWISHARESQEVSTGFSAAGTVLDAYGNDVKKLFSRLPPHLRFLGMIACESRSLLEGYRQQGRYATQTSLVIHSYAGTIGGDTGMRQALEAAQAVFERPVDLPTTPAATPELVLEGRLHTALPDSTQLFLELNDEPMGVFAAGEELEAVLTRNQWSWMARRNIKVTSFTTDPARRSPPPALSFHMPGENVEWEMFGLDGRALGEVTQLYVYRAR